MGKQRRTTRDGGVTKEAPRHDTLGEAPALEAGPPGPGMMSRQKDFERIAGALERNLVLSSSAALVAEGDSLALVRAFPQHCVSLVLTDPPYHATKKKNVYGDRAFREDQSYLDWMAQYAAEWRRVLRPNGSLFLFCDSSMAGRLESLLRDKFNVLSHIVWTKPNDPGFDGWKGKMRKEALRQWYPHSERILFAEPAAGENLYRSPFGQLLRQAREAAGLTMHQLTARIGAHGKVNHGGAVSNWEDGRNTPSREQYEKICKALIETGKVRPMPAYEDVIRVFSVDSSREFTDVWDFASVRPYKGKHPAEKPSALLEHAISATTYPGDVVVDCFGGGGSTAVAALRLNRRTVSIEIDPAWASKIALRVEEFYAVKAACGSERADNESCARVSKYKSGQMDLFSVGA